MKRYQRMLMSTRNSSPPTGACSTISLWSAKRPLCHLSASSPSLLSESSRSFIAGPKTNRRFTRILQSCFTELWDGGTQFDCHPYRLPISAMKSFAETTSRIYWCLVEAIKDHLDPKGLISPGRYSPLKIFEEKA